MVQVLTQSTYLRMVIMLLFLCLLCLLTVLNAGHALLLQQPGVGLHSRQSLAVGAFRHCGRLWSGNAASLTEKHSNSISNNVSQLNM